MLSFNKKLPTPGIDPIKLNEHVIFITNFSFFRVGKEQHKKYILDLILKVAKYVLNLLMKLNVILYQTVKF